MKKTISILLSVMMILSLGVPMSAFAQSTIKNGKLSPNFSFEYDDANKEYTVDGCGKLFSDDTLDYYNDNNMYCDGIISEEQGKSIEKLVFKQGVTVIGVTPFDTFYGLKEVTIPSTTKRIIRKCFTNKTNIETINYGGTPEQWKQVQIDSGNDGLKNATINYNVDIPKSKGADTYKDQATKKVQLTKTTYSVLDYYTGEVKICGKGRPTCETVSLQYLYGENEYFNSEVSFHLFLTDVINSITIEEGITSLTDIFNFCSATKISIAKSVKGISENSFAGTELTDVYYAGNIVDWNNIVIKSGNYEIEEATMHYASKVHAKDLKYKLSTTNYVYDGKSHTPAVTVTDKYGRALKRNTDYTLTYDKGRTSVGKYKVFVQLKGQYSSHKTMYLTIAPKGTSVSKINTRKNGFTVFWKQQKVQTNGYEVQYSTASNFKSSKTITMKKNTNYAKRIDGLKSGKKYYVRVRAYKNITVNGKSQKCYSAWTKTASTTVK